MLRLEAITTSAVRKAGLNPAGFEICRQVYNEGQPKPEGVVVAKTTVHYDERGGHFMELVRFQDCFIKSLFESGIKLNLGNGQANSAWIVSATERFGHVHRDQDEMWIVTKGTLVVALFDMRRGKTYGYKSRLVLHEGTGLRIPPGVVHGLGNYTDSGASLIYFTSHPFSPTKDTQEWRAIPKDPNFWLFARPDVI